MKLTDLREQQSAAALLPVLHRVLTELGNVSSGLTLADQIRAYVSWSDATDRAIGNILNQIAVASWVYDDQHWRLREMPITIAEQPARDFLRQDCWARRHTLESLRDQAQAAARRWDGQGDIVVLDTSMIQGAIGQGHPLDGVPWNETMNSRNDVRLVLPLAVIAELDRNKHPSNKNRDQAIAVIKWIDTNLDAVDRPAVLRQRRVATDLRGLSIEFFIEPLEPTHDDTDLAVIETTAALQRLTTSRVVLGTRDTSMRWRAAAIGLQSYCFPFTSTAQDIQ